MDVERHQIHTAVTGPDGIQICSAAYTGQAIDTGTSWTCVAVGSETTWSPDVEVAPDGTRHVAWSGPFGLAYANSLGSFLATNFAPQVRFSAPSSGVSAAILPTSVFDPDGDDMSNGQIHVGRHEHVGSLLWRGTTMPLFYDLYTLTSFHDNSYLSGKQLEFPWKQLEFKPVGGTSWDRKLYRNQVPTLPAMIEARHTNGETVGSFIIMAWDDVGIVVGQGNFVPLMTFDYSGNLPNKVDISGLPEGDAMIKITASDGSSIGYGLHGFTKTADQVWLVLTSSP